MLPLIGKYACLLLLTTVALAACSGSGTPQLIGAYPRAAVATYAPPPRSGLVIYDAYLDLRVRDVADSAAQAEALTYEHGGYLTQSQSWYEADRLHVTLSLAVPVANYDALHAALLHLGTLETERVSGSLASYSDGSAWNHFSTITVHFSAAERAWRWPSLPAFGWSPLDTFRAAFSVFAGIFTYLVDILIWVTVVFGPFVLMGLGLRALVRRWRQRP